MGNRRLKIAIIEDESDVLESLSVFFQRNDVEVKALRSGEEALREFDPDVSLVIVDYVLEGGMSGLEFLNRLREKSNVPVVLITASVELDREMLAKKFDAVFFKPFRAKSVLETVKKLVA